MQLDMRHLLVSHWSSLHIKANELIQQSGRDICFRCSNCLQVHICSSASDSTGQSHVLGVLHMSSTEILASGIKGRMKPRDVKDLYRYYLVHVGTRGSCGQYLYPKVSEWQSPSTEFNTLLWALLLVIPNGRTSNSQMQVEADLFAFIYENKIFPEG